MVSLQNYMTKAVDLAMSCVLAWFVHEYRLFLQDKSFNVRVFAYNCEINTCKLQRYNALLNKSKFSLFCIQITSGKHFFPIYKE